MRIIYFIIPNVFLNDIMYLSDIHNSLEGTERNGTIPEILKYLIYRIWCYGSGNLGYLISKTKRNTSSMLNYDPDPPSGTIRL